MKNRPVLKIPLNNSDKILEYLSRFFLILSWIIVVLNYTALPEKIPVHFNIMGQADGYGEKWILWSLPVISTILFVAMTVLNKYPHTFNYLVTITEENALKQYSIATRMIRYLKFVIAFLFYFLVHMTIAHANGNSNFPGPLFLPVFLGLIFIPLVFSLFKGMKS